MEDVRAHHVRGHQIRRALHALKSQIANARQRFHGQRFRKSRYAFQKRVAAAEHNQQKLIHHFPLSDDDLGHFRANVRSQACDVFHD
jgi:uncharacterized protein YukE